MPVAFPHHFHDVIHRELGGNLAPFMPSDPVGEDGKQNRRGFARTQHERADRIAVLVVLAGHARMGLCFDGQMRARCAVHG